VFIFLSNPQTGLSYSRKLLLGRPTTLEYVIILYEAPKIQPAIMNTSDLGLVLATLPCTNKEKWLNEV
jgi:hypothetical protein